MAERGKRKAIESTLPHTRHSANGQCAVRPEIRVQAGRQWGQLEQQLAPIEEELRVALQTAEDTGLQASSEAWEGFLAYYGVLSSMAQRMPEVAADLQSVVEFMAKRSPKK